MKQITSVLFVVLSLACTSPFEPEPPERECSILDFETGFINSLGDYEQGRFMVQYVLDPRVVSVIENGALAFKTDSTSFQFEVRSNEANLYWQFFDLNGLTVKADTIFYFVIVGDDFDTLRVFGSGAVAVPDTMFRETTQIHAYGRARNFIVDSLAVCAVNNE